MAFQSFTEARWIRDRMFSVNEERPCRPEDMIDISNEKDDSGQTVNFTDYYDSPSGWKRVNPRYQEVLNRYIMRRFVFSVTAHRDCASNSLAESEINEYIDTDFTLNSPVVWLPQNGAMFIPGPAENKIYLISFDISESGAAGKCTVTATWKRSGKWKRYQVEMNE